MTNHIQISSAMGFVLASVQNVMSQYFYASCRQRNVLEHVYHSVAFHACTQLYILIVFNQAVRNESRQTER